MSVADDLDAGWVPPFTIGETFTRELVFDVESIKTFSRLALDVNPLHLDEEYAATTRFGGLIASGTHTIAWSTGPLAGFVSSRCSSLGLQFDYTLRRAIKAGETARLEWRVDDIVRKDSLRGYILHMTGRLINSEGQDAVIVKGTSLVLPKSALAG